MVPDASKVGSLINHWEANCLPDVTAERELVRCDTTVLELQAEGKLMEDETYILTKVIDVNIKREVPNVLKFLTESSRFLLFKGVDDVTAKGFENWYAGESREGDWWAPHVQVYYGGAVHGLSHAEVIADTESLIGTRVEFVPNEEFVYNSKIKDVQMASMLARKFVMPVTYLRVFGAPLKFEEAKIKAVEDQLSNSVLENNCTLYKVYYRSDTGVVMCRWWCKDTSEFMSEEVMHMSGALDAQGMTVPSKVYPFIPFRYTLTNDTVCGEFQGRANYDEPLQEGIQAMTSAFVNGAVRSSGLYPYIDEAGGDGGNSIKSLDGATLKHGAIMSRKLGFMQLPYPDASLLNAVQLLKTTSSNDAGQTSYATTTKRMTNTTATEIAASTEQEKSLSSLGTAMLARYMFAVEKYRFEIFRANLYGHKAVPPEFAAVLMKLQPRSVIDKSFVSRDEKLAKAKQYLEVLKGTPAFAVLLKTIITEDLPEYSHIILDALADHTPDVAKAMLMLLMEVAKAAPELAQDPHYAQIVAAAQQTLGVTPASPAGMAQQPPNAGSPQGPSGEGAGAAGNVPQAG